MNYNEDEVKNEYIFGIHPILEALNTGKNIEKILIAEQANGSSMNELRDLARKKGISVQHLPNQAFHKFKNKNHQGVLALISSIETQTLDDLLPGWNLEENPLVLFLDGVSDIRNFGGIVRSANAAGVKAVVVPKKGAAAINADAIKTSAGALYHTPICRSENLVKDLEKLIKKNFQVVVCTEKAKQTFYEIDYKMPCVLIFGSEHFGVDKSLSELSDFQVKIPMLGQIKSLNVSVAAALVLYEALRQKL